MIIVGVLFFSAVALLFLSAYYALKYKKYKKTKDLYSFLYCFGGGQFIFLVQGLFMQKAKISTMGTSINVVLMFIVIGVLAYLKAKNKK